jgi:CubicO group peptidase (beta-lactamase class C family)
MERGVGNNKRVIKGTVAPGFESVQVLYERNMNNLAEEYSQLCVYHKGEKVVDLWAQGEDTNEFSADSLINVFSSGKSLESIALATLVDKGLLLLTKRSPTIGQSSALTERQN